MSSKNSFRGIELLSLLMPKFVINHIKTFNSYGLNIADDAGEPTILMCDIDGFDKIMQLVGNDIVNVLDELYRNFDKMCTKHGIQKIETVGKTYMVAGGLSFVESQLPEELQERNYTLRVMNLSLDMLKFAANFKVKGIEKIQLKIGIHRGMCLMGIIGYHKPQFSLIGDTINFASRHCSTGITGHVMISQAAWKHSGLTDEIPFQIVPTEMRGKGIIDVYRISIRTKGCKTTILQAIDNIDDLILSNASIDLTKEELAA